MGDILKEVVSYRAVGSSQQVAHQHVYLSQGVGQDGPNGFITNVDRHSNYYRGSLNYIKFQASISTAIRYTLLLII